MLFIAISIKNIVDISGNKQFVKTRARLSFTRRNRCTVLRSRYFLKVNISKRVAGFVSDG